VVTDQPTSRAVERFREFVRQRRALLPRKKRGDREVYEVASLRQIIEQVGLEMNAGIVHDAAEVRAMLNFAEEKVESKRAQKASPKPRFRGLGR
jgi:hypothetical protein